MLSRGVQSSKLWVLDLHRSIAWRRATQWHTFRRYLTTGTPFEPVKDRKLSRLQPRINSHENGQSRYEGGSRSPIEILSVDDWELTVGIEIHAELNTSRKLFSGAATSVNEEPNSNVALFDLAYPGSQPQFQPATLLPALRAAIALNCEIQHKSSFDRKHYFYQDQPAGYQITQYYGSVTYAFCVDES